jgi:SAM-dependent methyltransferase
VTSELDRIRRVYKGYAGDARRKARWDATAPANQAIVAERWRLIADLLGHASVPSLKGLQLLEVGCGTGGNLEPLTRLGLNPEDYTGVDLLSDRLTAARQAHPHMSLALADGAALPFPAATFDAVMFFTVFSSVLDPSVARVISRDATRVLRSGGLVLWYDMRIGNPSNRNVAGMNRRRIGELFPGASLTLRSATVAPPLARALGPTVRQLYPALTRIPALHTHWVGVLGTPSDKG